LLRKSPSPLSSPTPGGGNERAIHILSSPGGRRWGGGGICIVRGIRKERRKKEIDMLSPIRTICTRNTRAKTYSTRRALEKALAGEAPRFEKGKGSGAKEDPSPASSISYYR
jgi:hypothetical protein